MIQISKLRLVNSPETFFSIDKILFVDVLTTNNPTPFLKIQLELNFNAFMYDGKLYLPITLKGSPEKLFTRIKKGVEINLIEGISSTLSFDGDLIEALKQKKIYDFSKEYKSGKIEFAKEIDFLIDRYIAPHENK